jgi:transcription elongation GreA/GreB family factor
MRKQEIHNQLVDKLDQELTTIRTAARHAYATATDQEHQAENKYDTFSLESSYLARGQAKRVAELTSALERLRMLPLKELDRTTPIVLSALVRLEAEDGEVRILFLGPAGGGECVDTDDGVVTVVTSVSPIGRALVGQRVGHQFRFPPGPDGKSFTIAAVS